MCNTLRYCTLQIKFPLRFSGYKKKSFAPFAYFAANDFLCGPGLIVYRLWITLGINFLQANKHRSRMQLDAKNPIMRAD
jgi:hypothetical protein